MNVLHVSTYDNVGGAARAAFRLNVGLDAIGVRSRMLVAVRTEEHRLVSRSSSLHVPGGIRLRSLVEAVPLRWYPRRVKSLYSLSFLPEMVLKDIDVLNPDIINLHWICHGFLSIETLQRIRQPIVWTLHDMWPFTGGCHYDSRCGGYQGSCGTCPQLGSGRERDLTRWVWKRKMNGWKDVPMTVVAPSRWIAQRAQQSSLFASREIAVIPNGIDPDLYVPCNRHEARSILHLPPHAPLILFGAHGVLKDPRKGREQLEVALNILADRLQGAGMPHLVVFGAAAWPGIPGNRYPVHVMGQIHDDTTMAMLYAASDAFIAPSIEDNLPNTVLEALACGTPCIVFDVGGMSDLIQHKKNGYLARPLDPEDLALGIEWVMGDDQRLQGLAREARSYVEHTFDIRVVAKRYLDLYQDVIRRNR